MQYPPFLWLVRCAQVKFRLWCCEVPKHSVLLRLAALGCPLFQRPHSLSESAARRVTTRKLHDELHEATKFENLSPNRSLRPSCRPGNPTCCTFTRCQAGFVGLLGSGLPDCWQWPTCALKRVGWMKEATPCLENTGPFFVKSGVQHLQRR